MKPRGWHPAAYSLSVIALWLPLCQSAVAQKVSLSRTSLDFGTYAVGKTSSAFNVILTNTDASLPLAITIAVSRDYSESDDCNELVAPSGICTLLITFKPTVAGTITGVVSLNDDASNTPQLITLTGKGVIPVSVTPATLTFATVAVGSASAAKTVTLANNLSKTVKIGFAASGDYTAAGSGTSPCGASLASKASCTLAVQFKPTVAGVVNGALTVTQNIDTIPQIVTFSGTGSGGGTPPLTFTPTSVSFGSVGTGISSTKTVVITNSSAKALTISDLAASASYTVVAGSSSPCGGTLIPGNACTISVTFKPTIDSKINGAVTITDNGSVKTQILDLSGTGVAPVKISPTSLSFANQSNGTTSPAQTVTITNKLKSALSLNSIATSADYSTTSTCGSSLASAASCTISVTFSPIARTGSIPGTLTIVSNASTSPHLVELTGSASGKLPRFAYVANSGENTVSMYTVDIHSGQLRSNGYVLAGSDPGSVSVDPANKFAYVANFGDGTISAYKINSSSGWLTEIAGSPYPTGFQPFAATMHPSGHFIYVANSGDGTVSAFSINSSTGALSAVPGSPFVTGDSPEGITIDPSGKFAYVTSTLDDTVSAYTIDSGSGALTAVKGSPFPAGVVPTQLVIDSMGKFVYISNADGTISTYSINASTGALAAIGSPVAAGMSPFALAVDHLGKFLFVGIGDPSQISVYGITVFSIDPGTGALTEVTGSPFNVPQAPGLLAVDATNQFLCATVQNSDLVMTYAINPATGALMAVQTTASRSDPFSIAMTSGATPIAYAPRAYVSNFGDGNVSAYNMNPSTGALSLIAGSPFASGAGPFSVAVDPLGRFVYTADADIDAVSGDAINGLTGALTPVLGSPFAAGSDSQSVAIDPLGRFAYVVDRLPDDTISAYTINSSTGALSPVPGSPYAAGLAPSWLAVDPSGRFVYAAGGNDTVYAYTINPSNGALTSISGSPFTAGPGPVSIAIDPLGRFAYVTNYNNGTHSSVSAFTIDPGTGALTQIAGSPFATGNGADALVVDPSGRFTYVANYFDDTLSAFAINPGSGALSVVFGSPFFTGSGPHSVAVDPSGRFVYVANFTEGGIGAYAIDPSSGTLTPLSDSPFTAGNEPASVAFSGRVP